MCGLEARRLDWDKRLAECERLWAQHEQGAHERPAPGKETVPRCKSFESPAKIAEILPQHKVDECPAPGGKIPAGPTVRDLWGLTKNAPTGPIYTQMRVAGESLREQGRLDLTEQM
jgi:hypothetical protein